MQFSKLGNDEHKNMAIHIQTINDTWKKRVQFLQNLKSVDTQIVLFYKSNDL